MKFQYIIIILLLFGLLIIKNLYDNNSKYINDQDIQDKNYKKYFNINKNNSVLIPKSNLNDMLKTGYKYQHGSDNINRDFKKAEDMYKISSLSGSNKSLVYLGNLYHDSVNTQNDPDNNNVKKALYYYNLALKQGYYECLLDIGDIYLWGLSSVNQDIDIAIKCYTSLSNKGTNNMKISARERLEQIKDEFNIDVQNSVDIKSLNQDNYIYNPFKNNIDVQNSVDIKSLNQDNYIYNPFKNNIDKNLFTNVIPNINNNLISNIDDYYKPLKIREIPKNNFDSSEFYKESRQNTFPLNNKLENDISITNNFKNFTQPKKNDYNTISVNNINLYDLDEIDADQLDIQINTRLNLQNFNENIGQIEPINPNRIRNDHQNVHDHVVNKTLKKTLSKLKENTNLNLNPEKCLIEIRSLINNDNTNKKEDALKTLDFIEKKNNKLSSMNMSEVDALQLVWNRIHDPKNRNNSDNLKSNLINELAECNEPKDKNKKDSKKIQVCSTGRFSRIIDTLNMCDYDNSIKIIPKDVLNKELMDKAAKIRENMLNNSNSELKEAINTIKPDDYQDKLVDTFTNNLKSKLIKNFNKEYVEEGIISNEVLKSEIDKWIDYI